MANFSGIIAKMIRHVVISQGTCLGVDPLANIKPCQFIWNKRGILIYMEGNLCHYCLFPMLGTSLILSFPSVGYLLVTTLRVCPELFIVVSRVDLSLPYFRKLLWGSTSQSEKIPETNRCRGLCHPASILLWNLSGVSSQYGTVCRMYI